MAARFAGEQKTWHKTTLDFVSNVTFNESASTFRDYRLDVTFTHKATGTKITVPGFFAADGDAADTNATSGKIWRVNFNAPLEGQWTYEASFRTGKDIAASTSPTAGKAVGYIDGESGSFSIARTDKTGDDFRAKGMILQDEGTNYLQFQGDKDYFVRGGPGIPENFLATSAFDNTPGTLDYSTHSRDFNSGDPTWDGGKGKNILGAINYLAEQGQNSVYLMTLTAGGDGKDVWPWAATTLDGLAKNTAKLDPAITSVYDVSKLAQWEIVFDFMDEKGIYKNILLQERENDQLLNGGTDVAGTSLSAERMIYMREMVARFGSSNGIQWNLGEENSNTTQERKDMASWLEAVDPYDHLVVVHTWPTEVGTVYNPLLGFESFDGTSFQASLDDIRGLAQTYRNKSDAAGDPWVISWDENSTRETMIDPYSNNPDSAKEQALREGMWGFLTAGGSGVSWYVRQSSGQSYDQSMDTFGAFESLWTWTAAATEFFNTYIPFWDMQMADTLTADGDDFVMADPGRYYVVYLPYGEAGDVRLDLRGQSGEKFDIFWYNPRTGGQLIADGSVSGGSVVQVGGAPSSGSKDWVLLARNSDLAGGPEPEPDDPDEPTEPPTDPVTGGLIARDDSAVVAVGGEVRVLVLDNDADPDGTAVWIDGFSQGSNGSVSKGGGGRLIYAPKAGFSGSDSFTYTAIDEDGDTDTATVTVRVGEGGGVEPPPPPPPPAPDDGLIARDDSAVVAVGGEVRVLVLDNDDDPDGTAVWIDGFSQGSNGSVSKGGGGRLIYAPKAGFSGSDSFTYTAIDEDGDTDTATVTVRVGEGGGAAIPSTEAETKVVAPFDLSGSSLGIDDVFLFGFGTDGMSAKVAQKEGRIGVADVGSGTEIDYRAGAGSEMIAFDFKTPTGGMTLDLGGLNIVGGMAEGAILRTYGADGEELADYLITRNTAVTLDFGEDARFASLESAPWIGEGSPPASEPDFYLENFSLA